MSAKTVIRTDNDLINAFARTMGALGRRDASIVFQRAMSRGGSKTNTAVKRALRKQTSAKARDVNAATQYVRPSRSNLQTKIIVRGGHMSLKQFGAKQFSYGVRAKVWGESKRFEGAFVVGKLGGHAFVRETSKRFPIRKMYGPALPKEVLKDDAIETFNDGTKETLDRLQHELDRFLARRVKGR